MLAQAMQESNPAVAAGHARYALELDAAADVRLIVAQALIDDRDAAGAVRVLAAPFDPHAADDTYYAVNKMALLAAAGATAEVAALHDALRAGERYYNRSAVIDALLAVKAEDRARAELELFSKNAYGSAGARRLFYFELEHGTTEQALVAYEVLRDHGWAADPLGVLRVSLQVREISLRIRARDFLAIVGFTLAAASIAVACAIPIMLVHYRGLARRARANEPYPVGAWRLRDAWLASFLFSVASLVAGYTVGPFDVNADGSGAWWSGLTDAQMARLNVVGSALALAFLLPVAARGRTADARWWGEQGKVVRGMGLAVAIALLLRVPMLIAFAADSEMVRSAVFELEIWQLLEHIRASFGIGVALWLVVVFAPVVEEFVFRGVLLRAFAAHLNFWAANLFQAVLFAAMHLDPSAFPYLVLVGAAAGWLARRSGGLAAPIALHVVFNLVAALIAFA